MVLQNPAADAELQQERSDEVVHVLGFAVEDLGKFRV